MSVTTGSGGSWLHATPVQGVAAPTQTVAVVADPTSLAPGDYYGLIRIDSLTALNAPLFVTIVLNVTATSKESVSQQLGDLNSHSAITPAPVDGCGVTLFPTIKIAPGFVSVASWPTPIEVVVMDGAGQPVPSTGLVSLAFSNGDAPLSLTGIADGHWSGTWTPGVGSASAVISAKAQFRDLEGCATLSTNLILDAPAPIVSAGGILNAAGFVAPNGVSPGEMLSIFGRGFGMNTVSAPSLPLPLQLADTQLVIAGRSMPLLFSSSGQINAVLPADISPDTAYSVIAIRGTKISVPTPVLVAHTNPAVFTTNGMGTLQAHAYSVTSSGLLVLADGAHPAVAGNVLVVYATGLGPVDFVIAPGAPAPLDRLVNAKESITATLGGVAAPIAFAGLAPGFSGLYQVNLTIPLGTPRGNAVNLVLNGPNNQASPPVTVAVQ